MADLESVLFLLCLDRPEEARCKFAEAEKAQPESELLRKGNRSLYEWPICFALGNSAAAAELFLSDSGAHLDDPFHGAEQAVKAGILLELAGKPDRARELWLETSRRYPESRCSFLGRLAQGLLQEDFGVEQMPYGTHTRGEIFFLVGSLYEARGRGARARQLFQLCATEDLSRRWPVWAAEKKLREK
jgi:hypothetical protein